MSRSKRTKVAKSTPSSNRAAGATAAAIVPDEFFALRTPLLPIEELRAFSDGLTAAGAQPEVLAHALAADRRRLRERLRVLLARPEVREALFLASPSLDESLPLWLEEPESERGQKVERALVRYFARMCARPTPFGLFAGCSVGVVGERTQLELHAREQYRRHTRLDGDYLSILCDRLGRDPAIRSGLIYRPNSSLYRTAGRLRYAEARLDGKTRSYSLVAVEPSEYLEATLERAKQGARLAQLAESLVDGEITLEEAASFVHDLVDAQLLVPDLEPQVTGDEPVHDLISQLREHATARVLDETRAMLEALDERPCGTSTATYREIAGRLGALPVEADPSRLFQVDLMKPATASLGRAPVEELVRVISLLHRLAPTREGALQSFRDAFKERYQDQEVPLAQALDEEMGIGFDRPGRADADVSPLLDGMLGSGGREPEPTTGPLFELLLRRLHETLRLGSDEIVLDEKELEPYARAKPTPLRGSLAAVATLIAPSAAAVDAGEFRVLLEGVGGPSGANLLGRFCHGDPVLADHVRRHLRQEEARRPDAVFVEMVHLPEGRVGNIMLRPLLRDHELVFLGRSGAPPERQIHIEDLTVRVVDDRVVLRSRRLDREVIVRLTAAHAFYGSRNLAVYRFLCALQYQDLAAVAFSWGALQQAPYLPRLRVGRTLLSLARWRLIRDDLEPLGRAEGDSRFVATRALRRKLQLPRWVTLVDGDNQLPIDFDNVLSVETFVQLVKGRREVTLNEMLSEGGSLAGGPEGAFTHELVVPFFSLPVDAVASPRAPTATPSSAVVRQYSPGSEWLYAKLYTGSATADEVLRSVVAPVVAEARASGAADSWFFIRYGDPQWHVRVRFHGDRRRLTSEVLPALHAAAKPAQASGQIWKIQLDTYEREVERYGGPEGIVLAEALFCADSDAALGIMQALTGDQAADARWRIVLRGMEQLLDDFGFSLEARHSLISGCRDGLATELGGGTAELRRIGDKFRTSRVTLERLVDPAQDEASVFRPVMRIFGMRSQRLRPIAAELRALAAAGRLTTSVANLVGSALHMHANRLLRGRARAQERVLYDFLCRLYEGRFARQSGARGEVIGAGASRVSQR